MAGTHSIIRTRVNRLLCFFIGHEEGNTSWINEPYDDRVFSYCQHCHKQMFLYDAGELAAIIRREEARAWMEYLTRR